MIFIRSRWSAGISADWEGPMCLTPLLQCMLSSSACLQLAYSGVAARLHRKSHGHGKKCSKSQNEQTSKHYVNQHRHRPMVKCSCFLVMLPVLFLATVHTCLVLQ